MSYAIVLGASTGVGARIAWQLAQEHGYNIIGFHRGNHDVEADLVRDGIQKMGRKCWMIRADAGADAQSVFAAGLRMIPAGLPKDAKINVLVHSLASASVGSAIGISPQKVERTFNVMAHSFLYWVQQLHNAKLLTTGAHLIALTNPCVDFYLRNTGVIGAAKSALEGYVRTLAVEFRGAYFVNAVRFSTVRTPALEKVLSPEAVERLVALHKEIVPLGRMQTAVDVAHFVCQLVGDRWANGAILDYTGGPTLTLMERAFNG